MSRAAPAGAGGGGGPTATRSRVGGGRTAAPAAPRSKIEEVAAACQGHAAAAAGAGEEGMGVMREQGAAPRIEDEVAAGIHAAEGSPPGKVERGWKEEREGRGGADSRPAMEVAAAMS